MSFLQALKKYLKNTKDGHLYPLLVSIFYSFGRKNFKVPRQLSTNSLWLVCFICSLLCWVREARTSGCHTVNICYADDHRTWMVSDYYLRSCIAWRDISSLDVSIHRNNRGQARRAFRTLPGHFHNCYLFNFNFFYWIYPGVLFIILYSTHEFCRPVRPRNIQCD